MFLNLLLVGAGGFVGSIARYLVYVLFVKYSNFSIFPIATLAVNVIGCFLIGLASQAIEKLYPAQSFLMLLVCTGVLGGFTTFSAFGLETITLLQKQEFNFAILNICLNLILGLGAVLVGRML